MTVTVYTKPDCVQCDATKNHLSKLGIPFTHEPMSSTAKAQAEAAGWTAAPIVFIDGKIAWGGYRPDRIKALVSTR